MKKLTILITILTLTSFVIAQSVDVKDDDSNSLIQINDEGSAGSITLPSVGSTLGSDKLYNNAGELYWGADQLATVGSSGGGYSVGDFAQGGVVFWVDETGEHGLVCAKEDQTNNVRWYAGTNGSTQAKGDGPFAGEMNTSVIIAAHVAIGDDDGTYAARICNELLVTEGGKTYGDWYLPSTEELDLMCQNKAIINATATANGGNTFNNTNYWSSTEQSSNGAETWYFQECSQGSFSKVIALAVRAVRAF